MTKTNVAYAASMATSGARVNLGAAVYNEIAEFLIDEAAILDNQDFAAWAAMLAEDLSYTAPMRQTRVGADRGNTIVSRIGHFDDDYLSIMGRIGRLATKSAWAEDPPSRTRRLVTNVRVWETDKAGEYSVISYLLLSRSRYEESELQILTAERRDRIRRTDGGWTLASREIIVDQSVLGMQNLAVFL